MREQKGIVGRCKLSNISGPIILIAYSENKLVGDEFASYRLYITVSEKYQPSREKETWTLKNNFFVEKD